MPGGNAATPIWDNFDDIPAFSPAQKIQMQLLSGETLMMNMVTIEPGGIVPEHSHHNEQCGYVISGTLVLTMAGETRQLGPGACYLVPSNAVHSGATDENGCVVLDIFAPPRADYVALQDQARAAALSGERPL